MRIELVTLAALQEELRDLGQEAFTKRYPGAFLLAMGFLATETIRARRKAALNVQDVPRDATAAVTFGPRLRYDPLQSHPLAGCAFFMCPTSTDQGVVIGRSQRCDITVPDPSVSERHCRIEVTQQGVMVTDLDSTNGTTVNLERLERNGSRVLADEDFISIGRYSFQLLTTATLYDELALLNALDE
jgi:hypothetical protein